MKKSIKILTLVLSLALLCGALAVAAFASDTTEVAGVVVDLSIDFTGGTSWGSGEGAVVARKHGFVTDNKGSGVNNVVISEKDGNSYFSWDYTENAGTATGNYSYSAPKENTAWTSPTSYDTFAGYYYKDNSYYVFDFDIWFPKDVPSGAGRFYTLSYCVTETVDADTETSTWANPTENSSANGNAVAVKFANDASGGVTIQANGSDDVHSIIDGAWNHVTLITQAIVEEGVVTLKTYTVLNGTIIDVVSRVLEAKSADVRDDMTHWFPKTARFDFGGNDQNGNIMNVDNFSIRRLTKDYNGNLATVLEGGKGASIEAWESDLYDADKMPWSSLVATIGEAEYDNLQEAIDAAQANDVITLCADVTNATVVDKALTIDCGEYTCVKPSGAYGIAVAPINADGKYVAETYEPGTFYIGWGACSCGLDTCDETHPGDATGATWTLGELYNTIYSAYAAAGEDVNWTLSDGPNNFALVGFKDDAGNVYDATSIITLEMYSSGTLMLTPVIETTSATLSYVKDGKTTYASGDKAMSTAIANADSGSTITLFDDAKVVNGAISFSNKTITIDLNGHAINSISTSSGVSGKQSTFKPGDNADITVIGDKEGSAIFNFYAKTATSFQGNPVFYPGGNCKITLKGANLKVAAACLVGSWGNTFDLCIDGGYYTVSECGDMGGFIYGNDKAPECKVDLKNAIFNLEISTESKAVVDCRFAATATAKAATITIDNCVLFNSGAAGIVNASNTKVDSFTVTNSYIGGNIAPSVGVVTLGAGNYIASGVSLDTNVAYASGIAAISTDLTKDHATYAQTTKINTEGTTLVVDPSSFVFTDSTLSVKYAYETTTAVTVNFVDGDTVLTSVAARAGDKVIGPRASDTAESFADGWVIGYKSYAYTIPADATDDITVDIKDATEFEYDYEAGKPLMYMNFTLQANLAVNLYVQKDLPEGVSDLVVKNDAGTTRKFDKTAVIGGKEYNCSMAAWLTAAGADNIGKTYMIMSYVYDGQTVSYKFDHINVVDYAKAVAEIYPDDAEKLQQVTALLQFVDAANKVAGITPSTELTDYLATLTKVEASIPETYTNTSELGDYISGANVSVWSSNAGIGCILTDTAYTAYKNGEITFKVVAGEINLTSKKHVNMSNDGVLYTNNNAGLVNLVTNDITIQVLDADGTVLATGTYSFAAYYTEMADSLTEDQKYLVESLYALTSIGNVN